MILLKLFGLAPIFLQSTIGNGIPVASGFRIMACLYVLDGHTCTAVRQSPSRRHNRNDMVLFSCRVKHILNETYTLMMVLDLFQTLRICTQHMYFCIYLPVTRNEDFCRSTGLKHLLLTDNSTRRFIQPTPLEGFYATGSIRVHGMPEGPTPNWSTQAATTLEPRQTQETEPTNADRSSYCQGPLREGSRWSLMWR